MPNCSGQVSTACIPRYQELLGRKGTLPCVQIPHHTSQLPSSAGKSTNQGPSKVHIALLLSIEQVNTILVSSGVFGTDNQGHPIIVERFEDFKLDRILMFKEEDLVVYQARNMEVWK